ncbi:MAG: HEAT repeat domain-containing protein [Nitrospirae bacterium]|nr:HEAT repeat domain-containing protein [Nitrospirota bacterium]MBI5696531.1 HEAT repeat domain-containing protein [Nitrospirota bacterium]
MEQQQHHLKIVVVGLGQCGGNFADEFARLGYRAIALNTSTTDLKDLTAVPKDFRVHIGLSGRNGAGKDRRLGQKSVLSNRDKILERVKTLSRGADVLLLAGGMGGGTGSNLGDLVNLLAPSGLPVACLVTIPTESESGITKVNAIYGLNNIIRSKLASLIIVDNNKILKIFPDASIADFYSKANQLVARTLAEFNSTNDEQKSISIRSFDSEDFRKVFLSGGVTVFGAASVKVDGGITEDAIFSRLKHIWDSSGLLAEGFDYTTASLAAVIFYAPADVLERSSANIMEKLNQSIKKITQGAAVYTGIYQMKEPGPVKIFTMLGRLSLPNRIINLMSQAAIEGQHLAQKVKQRMPTLDLTEIESMEFFFEDTPAFDDKASMANKQNNLMAYLKDPDKEVRKRAVAALGEKADPKTSSVVISLLNDPDEEVRMEAAKALRRISAAAEGTVQ